MLPVQSLYQTLREQTVSILVEIEDKEKVCKMLEKKLQSERQKLAAIESRYQEDYTNLIEVFLFMLFREIQQQQL